MPFIASSNTGKVCFDFVWKGVGVSICLYFVKTSVPNATHFSNLAFAARDSMVDNLIPILSEDLTFNGVLVYDMSSATAPTYSAPQVPVENGGAAVDGVSRQVTAVITHRSNNRGRSARGRTYLPGLTDSDVVDGVLSSSAQTALQDAWDAFIADIEAVDSWIFVVASFYTDGAPRASAIKFEVTESLVRPYTGTQRRRNPIG